MPNFVDLRRFDTGPGALATRRRSCPLDGVGDGVSSDLILSSAARPGLTDSSKEHAYEGEGVWVSSCTGSGLS